MEKLGIAHADLLQELKGEYLKLREKAAVSLTKSAQVDESISRRMEQVKSKIDELEGQSD